MGIIENISEAKVISKISSESKEKRPELIKNLIFEYLRRKKVTYVYLAYESFKESDIKIVNDFLDSKKVDMKKYQKLALKVSKKWERTVYDLPIATKGISDWLTINHKDHDDEFYNRLKEFLFDFYPTATSTSYIEETGRKRNNVYIEKDTRQKAKEIHKIPSKAYYTHLASKYNSHYESMLKGYTCTSYTEFLNILKPDIINNFNEVTEAITPLNTKAQIKLLELLLEKKKEDTINFILNTFIFEASGGKVISYLVIILDKYYADLEDKTFFTNKIINFLTNKKKPVREISVELLIKWNLTNNKKLLTPLLNDKSKIVVDMIANFLAKN